MRKITKSDPQLQQVQHKRGAFIVGLLLLFFGGYCILEGLHLLPVTAEKVSSFKWDTFRNQLLSGSFQRVVLLLGCFLLLVSILAFIQGIRSWLNKRKRNALVKRYKQPWFSDYPWDPKGIHDRTGRIWLNSLLATISLAIIVIPLNWYTFSRETLQFGFLVIFTLFADLIMLVILWSMIYYVLYAVQHGKSYLSFARFPFFPGDKMRVTFSPNRFSALNCTLRFVKEAFEKEHSSDDDKTIICYELYSEQKLIRCSPKTQKILISFNIPETSPVWDNQLSGSQSIYYWELEIEAKHPGVDFCTTFLLPVYERQNRKKKT